MVADRDVREVVLFDASEHGPYGDARRNPLRPRSYESTVHGLVERSGFAPFFAFTAHGYPSGALGQRCLAAVDWVDSAGDPIAIAIIGDPTNSPINVAVRVTASGSLAIDEDFLTARPGVIPLALHSDGGTAPRLFCAFGTTNAVKYRPLAGAPWVNCSGTPSQASGVFSENGNLWFILTNGYQVRKFPSGVDPATGVASAAIDVGTSAWPITGAGLLARSLVLFIKPDGIYVYDIDTNKFENIWAGLTNNIHPDTGKGTFTWGGDVYVPLGWGGMVRVPATTLQPIPASPLPREALPEVKTPGRGRVLAMAADASYLYASLEPFTQRLGAGSGLKVVLADDLTTVDKTSVATDDNPKTTFLLSEIPTAGVNEAIYVGADVRHGGAYFLVTNAPVAGNSLDFIEYWNGTAWVSTGGGVDYTLSLRVSGVVVSNNPVPDDWALATVGGFQKYWLRYRFTALGGGAQAIAEVRALPDSPLLPGGDSVNQESLSASGLRTEIIRGYPVGEGFVWDTVASLPVDRSQALIFSRLLAAGGGRTLLAFGPQSYIDIPLGASGRPQEERFPNCVNGFLSILRCRETDEYEDGKPAPTLQKGIAYVRLQGKGFDVANDVLQAWASFDGEAFAKLGDGRTLPTKLAVTRQEAGRGYDYQVLIGLKDGVRGEAVPRITRVVAGVYPVDTSAEHE